MLTKERLKELIDEGATVYGIDNQYQPVQEIDLEEEVWMLERSNAILLRQNQEDTVIHLENLYEHKSDAEWDFEFENVEKRIKFVKPKPFREIGNEFFIYNFHGFTMYKYAGVIKLQDEEGDSYADSIIFDKPFNEENYIEACRLIKKLFMGE